MKSAFFRKHFEGSKASRTPRKLVLTCVLSFVRVHKSKGQLRLSSSAVVKCRAALRLAKSRRESWSLFRFGNHRPPISDVTEGTSLRGISLRLARSKAAKTGFCGDLVSAPRLFSALFAHLSVTIDNNDS